MMVNGNLPDGWEWKTIGDVTLPIEKVDPKQKPDKEFTYLDIASIDNSVHRITEPKSYYGSDAPSRARQLVRANDVLFSTVRTYLENIAQVPEIHDGQIASTGFSVLRANELVLPKYLFYYSLTQNFLEPLNELQRGTSYPAVRDGDVRVQMIPVAPLSEQERIVSRIEELFSDLEAGVAALERVRAGLKRYKASVLKAACEGMLFESRGVESSGELPDGWQKIKLEDICVIASGNTPKGIDSVSGNGQIPWYRVSDMNLEGNEEYLIQSQVYLTEEELKSLRLKTMPSGTIVFPKRGGAIATNKKRILNHPSGYDLNMMGILSKSDQLDGRYLWYWFLTIDLSTLSDGSNVPQINHGDIQPLLIPVPPLEEQRRIVAEVERQLSVVGEVESAVDVGLVRAGRLRQSVLRSAFEGRL